MPTSAAPRPARPSRPGAPSFRCWILRRLGRQAVPASGRRGLQSRPILLPLGAIRPCGRSCRWRCGGATLAGGELAGDGRCGQPGLQRLPARRPPGPAKWGPRPSCQHRFQLPAIGRAGMGQHHGFGHAGRAAELVFHGQQVDTSVTESFTSWSCRPRKCSRPSRLKRGHPWRKAMPGRQDAGGSGPAAGSSLRGGGGPARGP